MYSAPVRQNQNPDQMLTTSPRPPAPRPTPQTLVRSCTHTQSIETVLRPVLKNTGLFETAMQRHSTTPGGVRYPQCRCVPQCMPTSCMAPVVLKAEDGELPTGNKQPCTSRAQPHRGSQQQRRARDKCRVKRRRKNEKKICGEGGGSQRSDKGWGRTHSAPAHAAASLLTDVPWEKFLGNTTRLSHTLHQLCLGAAIHLAVLPALRLHSQHPAS